MFYLIILLAIVALIGAITIIFSLKFIAKNIPIINYEYASTPNLQIVDRKYKEVVLLSIKEVHEDQLNHHKEHLKKEMTHDISDEIYKNNLIKFKVIENNFAPNFMGLPFKKVIARFNFYIEDGQY